MGNKVIPTEIIDSGVVEIAAGYGFSLIVKDDGSVHSFGKNIRTIGDWYKWLNFAQIH